VRRPDAELVNRLRQGDANAFAELYELHAGRLYGLAYRMAGNGADADDLLQDIFLLVHRKLAGFKGESALGTWLYKLALNHCLDFLRSKGARMEQATASLDEDDGWERVRPTRVSDAEMTVTRIDLERAIEQLPAGCRAAFLLHDVEGFEHHQISTILGIAEGTSKSQVHKARMRLRGYLTSTTAAGVPK
jgi:RNA polymerase sigma-70 factor (ECF subfamily)